MRTACLRSTLRFAVLALVLARPAGAQEEGVRRPVPVRFARGATSARVRVALGPAERSREYALRARAGQRLTVGLTEAGVPGAFSVACPRCPRAREFRAFSTGGRWSGVLPATGTYVVRVASVQPGRSLSLALEVAAPAPPPLPVSAAAAPAAKRRPGPAADGERRPADDIPYLPGTPSPAARRAGRAGAAAAGATLPAPFRPMLPGLKRATGVPVLLPRELPEEMEPPLFAFGRGDANGYHVTLAHAPGCVAHACNAGYLDAARGRRPAGTRRLRLADGTPALFTPMACGASCAAPRLEWARGGVTYGMELSLPGSDAYHQAVLARMASSALRTGPR